MNYIVAYDIEDDRRRNQISRFLKSRGVRLQKSVYWVEVERYQFKGFLSHLRRIAQPEAGIIVFRLCKGCQGAVLSLSEQEDTRVVF